MTMENEGCFKIFFHIGAGKTGTSTIQESLRSSKSLFKEKGCAYWGIMLEHAPCKIYDWQKPGATEKFFSMPKLERDRQYIDVVSKSIEVEKRRNANKAIIVNESFFPDRKRR